VAGGRRLLAAIVPCVSPLHLCAPCFAGVCFRQASQHSPGVLVWKELPHFTTSPHSLQDMCTAQGDVSNGDSHICLLRTTTTHSALSSQIVRM
jgi:hypothetical protein